MPSEEDIMYETQNCEFWVFRNERSNFEVRVTGLTHSVVIATYHLKDKDEALRRAISHCDAELARLEAGDRSTIIKAFGF